MRPFTVLFWLIFAFAFMSLIACTDRNELIDVSIDPSTNLGDDTDANLPGPSLMSVQPWLLVVPFESRLVPRSAKQYTFALAAHLAERLENEPTVRVLNGPLVLTREQSQLLQASGDATEAAITANSTANAEGELTLNSAVATYNTPQLLALAKSVNAEYVLTGRFSGPIWDCRIEAEVWRVIERRNENGQTESFRTLAGRANTKADWTVPGKSRYGRDIRLTSAAKIHESFAEAVSQALANAGYPLKAATIEAVKTPSTRDAYALLLLSRSYVALHFAEDGDSERVIKSAAHAMSVDPRHYEAQRLYADLLYEGGNRLAARAHFEMAIEQNPNDVRSLVRLGVIETLERNNMNARDYLRRAAELRPQDAEIAYWTGRAVLAQNDRRTAQAEFERARDLDRNHADSRRKLAELYSADRRYGDAATELARVVELAPTDRESHFRLGACLRAAGRPLDAAHAYAIGATQFRADSRFFKFQGDMLMLAGRTEEAMGAHRMARRINAFDRRMSRALGKSIMAAPQIGSTELIDTIRSAHDLRDDIERNRIVYFLGTNDAILDLVQNGEQACLDGHGTSSALLAVQARERFDVVREQQASFAWSVFYAERYGEWDALTPDERQMAETVVADWRATQRDASEMRSQYQRTLLPLYRRNHCDEYDGPITPNSVEQVIARHRSREVTMPPARHVPLLPIAPDVPPQPALIVGFHIDNTEGQASMSVVLDGQLLGSIEPGTSTRFEATVGPHDLCVERDPAACARPDNVRNLYLHDGWIMRIRQRG